jgi:putative copper export protein
VLSGAAWLTLDAAQMSEHPVVAVWSEGTVWTVLFGTDFGHVWIVRSVLIILLAAALYFTNGLPPLSPAGPLASPLDRARDIRWSRCRGRRCVRASR